MSANKDQNCSYKCQYCNISFNRKSNCTRHEKNCALNDLKPTCMFFCSNCKASFTRADALKNHEKKCSLNKIEAPLKSRTPCLVEECNLNFFHKSSLISHLHLSHEDILVKEPVTMTFKTFEEFFQWKESEEENTYSYFAKKSGNPKNIRPMCQYYYCQHDGSAKVHSRRKTSKTVTKGRVKAGHFCIAKMKLWEDENKTIFLQYFPTHSHRCSPQDFVHHPLPQSTSIFIDKQIAEEVSPSKIFNKITKTYVRRNSVDVKSSKLNILTKKRIRERARRRRIALRFNKDDAKAVFLLAQQMVGEGSLLIYKPYGGKIVYGPSQIDDLPESIDIFMFATQTERQLQLLKTHCGKIFIVDETHGTNQYKYQLLTCMVVDENRRGWPVAHCITSKSDTETLKFFFSCMKSRLGEDFKLNCVITDDDSALINSMNEGFSTELRHILCIWHVFKNLKDNLRSKVDKEMFQEMLTEIKVIMKSNEATLFANLCQGFLNKYEKNEKAERFLLYFKQFYLNRPEKWAMCLRQFPHAEVNTTGHVESFHNKLKKVYLKRKVNKRLDDLINILNDMEWEDHCTRIRESNVGFSAMPQHIVERHVRGMLINDNAICNIFENTWEMMSATNENEVHVIVLFSQDCKFDLCFSKCLNLQCHKLCAHMYQCNCPDRHPLCKHIHKLHSFLTRGLPNFRENDCDFYSLNETLSQSSVNEIQRPIEESASDKRFNSIISRMESNVSKINSFFDSAKQKKVEEHTLAYADSVLSDLVLRLENCDTDQSNLNLVDSMRPVVKYHPQEKLKTQLSQLPAFKRPKGKRKLKPDPANQVEVKKTVVRNLLACLPDFNEKDNNLPSENNSGQENIL